MSKTTKTSPSDEQATSTLFATPDDDASEPQEQPLIAGPLALQPPNPLAPYRPPGSQGRRFATSLDLSDRDQKILAFRACQSQDLQAEDVIGQDFPIKHWLNVDASAVNPDTGELSEFVRTVLITEDGKLIGMASDWVLSSLMSLQAFFGRAPWSPAIRVKISAQKSRNGRRFFLLDVL